jgi:DNA-binding transcriptional ArsR family regulator/uncharacterized protein YndB with AHSA1/START domain
MLLREVKWMDEVFRALADPNRRLLLDRLRIRNGQNLSELCAGLGMARQSVTKHLEVLEAAGLVTSVRQGRERVHHLNAAPINDIADRWINRYDRARIEALSDLKHALEDTTMTEPRFTYTTYIHTTPEQLWRALTDPAFTERYWGARLESDWQVGSPVTWHEQGATMLDAAQVVLESDPPRRLAYTWHTFTPEWAAAHGLGDELLRTLAAERRSRVRFDIEQADDGLVRLTVVHDDFEPGSTVLQMVQDGWPRLLSDLKTLLESDRGPEPPAGAAIGATAGAGAAPGRSRRGGRA